MKIITDSRCTAYSRRGHPERPQRILGTVEKLRGQRTLPIVWLEPLAVEESQLVRAHSLKYVRRIMAGVADFDADTPAYPGIDAHARRGVGGALRALRAAQSSQRAFSLLRPPGHHATRDQAMGFCFFSSLAVAVLEALAGGAARVAVFDFDVHHGNGTEAILLDRPGAAFFSVHQHPAYPGSGQRHIRNCFNYPVAPGASRETYRAALTQAFEELKKFKPDVIGVSAGFDAFRGDPLSDEPLEEEDFFWLGEIIRKSGIPAFSVLEGGYSHELPELILSYLRGWEGA